MRESGVKKQVLSKNLVDKIVSILKDRFHESLHSVVLYGSYAKGSAQIYSDIDILIIVNRKFQSWNERRDIEIELRKKFYRTIGQVSPKIGSIEYLGAALENLNPLLLNILDQGIILFDDGTFNKLRQDFKQILYNTVIKHPDHWEIVA